MSSQAGSPPAPSADSSLQLPSQPKKRVRKEGGAAAGGSKGKGKGKAARLEGADGGNGEAQEGGQQQRRQSLAPQSAGGAGAGDNSLSRSQGASTSNSNAAAGPSNGGANADERPTKKGEKRGQQKLSRKNLFAKELPSLMYAFGDDPNPLPESVNVLEEILVDYVSDLCRSAAAHSPNAKKIRLDDLRFALRKPQQSKQLARLEELLYLQEDIARARKLDFDGIS